jgi:hypothetical protein
MGYRSQVRALIYGDPDSLTAHIAAWQLEHTSQLFVHFDEYLKRYSIETNDGIIDVLDLSLDHAKWYDEYDDVESFHSFMYCSEELRLHYEFSRVGEEATDIVQNKSDGHIDLLYLSSPSICDDIAVIADSEKPITVL